jgi:hypothetical protein
MNVWLWQMAFELHICISKQTGSWFCGRWHSEERGCYGYVNSAAARKSGQVLADFWALPLLAHYSPHREAFMKLHSRLLSILAITSTAALTNCGGGSGYSYQNITISVSPHITSIPVNTTMTFTATVTNAPASATSWVLLSYASANLGSPTVQAGGSTFKYTAPRTPPSTPAPDSMATPKAPSPFRPPFPNLAMPQSTPRPLS